LTGHHSCLMVHLQLPTYKMGRKGANESRDTTRISQLAGGLKYFPEVPKCKPPPRTYVTNRHLYRTMEGKGLDSGRDPVIKASLCPSFFALDSL
jgi:hypothetical protein